jgi:hypothetical protein
VCAERVVGYPAAREVECVEGLLGDQIPKLQTTFFLEMLSKEQKNKKSKEQNFARIFRFSPWST